MKTSLSRSLFRGFLPLFVIAPLGAETPKDLSPEPPKVQIALLLDTSNSMDGLIDQARTQLWKVVNTFTGAKRDGVTPYVEVALYEYGNSGLSIANHYIRLVRPFTRDLDTLSQDMFALKTNGGEEYCGAVIQRSLSDLAWDKSGNTYKAIFIAGNEPFTQGEVDVRQACRDALAKSIVVNTIHCGSREEGMRGAWHDGAALAEGKFLVIDQDRAVVHAPAPQDPQITRLNEDLNRTYIGYGKQSTEALARQKRADGLAEANAPSGSYVQRTVAKASVSYENSSWDLVDAVRENKVDLAKLPATDLPAEMRSMSPAERAAHIESAAEQRAAIQKKIAGLALEREAFLKKEREAQAADGEKSLDEVIVETTREQAANLGYVFGN